MARWEIKNVPEEMDKAIRELAERNRETMRTTVLQLVREAMGRPADVQETATSRLRAGSQPPTEVFQLPEWIPRIAWGHWEEVRRKLRKPLTEAAKKTAVGVLEKLRKEGNDPGEVLEQSVFRGWQGLFALNGGQGNGGSTKSKFQQRLDAVFADDPDGDSEEVRGGHPSRHEPR